MASEMEIQDELAELSQWTVLNQTAGVRLSVVTVSIDRWWILMMCVHCAVIIYIFIHRSGRRKHARKQTTRKLEKKHRL